MPPCDGRVETWLAAWICKKIHKIFRLHGLVQLFFVFGVRLKGREPMNQHEQANTLKTRIRTGTVSTADVTRRLAELAFGRANDCVRLALEPEPDLDRLDLSLLSEIRRNEKGTVEIRLIDRLRALEQLALAAGKGADDQAAMALLQALQSP